MDSGTVAPHSSPAICPQCGGECEAQVITLTLRCTQSNFAVVRNVPADVCQVCGESQFSMRTTGQLLAMMQASHPPAEVILIPIYDFANPTP
ncbi:MAG TPA: YgiT-type zinc finger protein [Chthonomonadaceae bacterium]|nr:YgiT-type zinc finger protein [Chthonomonadaceae bacterium]